MQWDSEARVEYHRGSEMQGGGAPANQHRVEDFRIAIDTMALRHPYHALGIDLDDPDYIFGTPFLKAWGIWTPGGQQSPRSSRASGSQAVTQQPTHQPPINV